VKFVQENSKISQEPGASSADEDSLGEGLILKEAPERCGNVLHSPSSNYIAPCSERGIVLETQDPGEEAKACGSRSPGRDATANETQSPVGASHVFQSCSPGVESCDNGTKVAGAGAGANSSQNSPGGESSGCENDLEAKRTILYSSEELWHIGQKQRRVREGRDKGDFLAALIDSASDLLRLTPKKATVAAAGRRALGVGKGPIRTGANVVRPQSPEGPSVFVPAASPQLPNSLFSSPSSGHCTSSDSEVTSDDGEDSDDGDFNNNNNDSEMKSKVTAVGDSWLEVPSSSSSVTGAGQLGNFPGKSVLKSF